MDMNILTTRFWAKVDKAGPDDCWLWTAATTNGYGVFWLASEARLVRSHRFSYEQLVGPIPEGLVLDHLCRTEACVNPTHLEPVTRGDNCLRGVGACAVHAKKTHCNRGHPFDLENTVWVKGGRGRECRACQKIRQDARAERRRASRA